MTSALITARPILACIAAPRKSVHARAVEDLVKPSGHTAAHLEALISKSGLQGRRARFCDRKIPESLKAASWIIAELIRLYHVDDENAVRLEMTALTRATFPLLESIDGQDFVSKKVPPRVEIQLLLGRKGGEAQPVRQNGEV